jgi:hypothetical protein
MEVKNFSVVVACANEVHSGIAAPRLGQATCVNPRSCASRASCNTLARRVGDATRDIAGNCGDEVVMVMRCKPALPTVP